MEIGILKLWELLRKMRLFHIGVTTYSEPVPSKGSPRLRFGVDCGLAKENP